MGWARCMTGPALQLADHVQRQPALRQAGSITMMAQIGAKARSEDKPATPSWARRPDLAPLRFKPFEDRPAHQFRARFAVTRGHRLERVNSLLRDARADQRIAPGGRTSALFRWRISHHPHPKVRDPDDDGSPRGATGAAPVAWRSRRQGARVLPATGADESIAHRFEVAPGLFFRYRILTHSFFSRTS